jgi:hypothetical protein
MLYMLWFWVETWSKKRLIHYYAYTNVTNRIVLSFVWRKFSSVGIGEWWDEVKNGQNLKLGDAHATPKKYPRGTSVKAWGCLRGTPSSSAKIRWPFKTLYFYCFKHYAFFLERQLFLLSFLFYFVWCNKWLDHIIFVLERAMLHFSLPRTL